MGKGPGSVSWNESVSLIPIVYSDDMSMACMSDNATPSSEGPSLSKYLNPEECDEDGGELETYKPFKPASQTSK